MMFGNIVIGTGVMVAAGVLSDIMASLSVSVTTAGHLISVGALVVCLGTPLFAALVAGWDRRKLLVGSLLWYWVWHALATHARWRGAPALSVAAWRPTLSSRTLWVSLGVTVLSAGRQAVCPVQLHGPLYPRPF